MLAVERFDTESKEWSIIINKHCNHLPRLSSIVAWPDLCMGLFLGNPPGIRCFFIFRILWVKVLEWLCWAKGQVANSRPSAECVFRALGVACSPHLVNRVALSVFHFIFVTAVEEARPKMQTTPGCRIENPWKSDSETSDKFKGQQNRQEIRNRM